MKKLTNDEQRVVADLGEHATHRIYAVLSDTFSLLDNKEQAYVLSVSVMGAMLCAAARMRDGKHKHATKIAHTLRDLAGLMMEHRNHD